MATASLGFGTLREGVPATVGDVNRVPISSTPLRRRRMMRAWLRCCTTKVFEVTSIDGAEQTVQ